MKRLSAKHLHCIFFLLIQIPLCAQEADSSIYMDFRNQKISDIIYAVADVCGKSVIIDETVSGNATFRFEDKDFESALDRFARQCQLYVEKNGGVYSVTKVRINANSNNGKLSINTENVQIEPFINMLSRYTNRTILFDNLPNATVTIRIAEASLEDVLNLAIVKLPGFGLERIADGFYITKSAGNLNKRNIDIFTMSEAGGKFSCNIQKASFANVIETLFKKGGKEYSLLSKPSITLENMAYTDKSFDELLSLILSQCNCDFSADGGIYYIYEIQKKDVIKKFKKIRIIKVKNISIETLASILPNELNAQGFIKQDKNSNSLILTGSPSEINPIEEFIRKVDVPLNDRNYKSFYFENTNAKDAVSLIPKALLLSDIIMLPSDNGFATQVTQESEAKLSEFIAMLDSKKQSKAIRLKYIKSDELIKSLPTPISKESITETNEPTLVFFSGTEKQFEGFSKSLEEIDVPKQQIKYQLFVVQRQKTSGLNWGTSLNIGNTSEGSGYSWSGAVSNIFNINFDIISKFGVQFAGSLNAELSEGKSRVFADTTLNGISGESLNFSNTSTTRYRDIIVDTKGDLYTSTTREISSGLTLSINGWASGDGMVTVKVDAQVSKQGNTESSSANSNGTDTTPPPSTSEKKVSTNVRTKSGEPVVIGGLFQQEEEVSEKRVPGFGNIPLLGWLFKKKVVSMVETEFVIYLVPFVEKQDVQAISEEENLERLKKKYGEAAV
ncbi:secretin N-terminal domain-containing protein [uncultured Treponema sp.]|uniref:secretin N-terminal domain-containing protein n=1 Tax=uncultured Treponema sp. TaxID=162155 RepID=UPI0025D6EB4F|nr:secretin N-terminal domain-containing protein [uncultured Treponema sp.]